MRVLASVLFFLLIVMQVQLWFGSHGVFKLRSLEQAIEEQVRVNNELSNRNQQLNAEVIELKEGKEALEDRARSQLGLIKEGEVFYRIIPRPDDEQN